MQMATSFILVGPGCIQCNYTTVLTLQLLRTGNKGSLFIGTFLNTFFDYKRQFTNSYEKRTDWDVHITVTTVTMMPHCCFLYY